MSLKQLRPDGPIFSYFVITLWQHKARVKVVILWRVEIFKISTELIFDLNHGHFGHVMQI